MYLLYSCVFQATSSIILSIFFDDVCSPIVLFIDENADSTSHLQPYPLSFLHSPYFSCSITDFFIEYYMHLNKTPLPPYLRTIQLPNPLTPIIHLQTCLVLSIDVGIFTALSHIVRYPTPKLPHPHRQSPNNTLNLPISLRLAIKLWGYLKGAPTIPTFTDLTTSSQLSRQSK